MIEINDSFYIIDAGVAYKDIKDKYFLLSKKVFDPKKLKAIFITHYHGDHIKSLTTLYNMSNCLIYAPAFLDKIKDQIKKKSPECFNKIDFESIISRKTIEIDNIKFKPFSTLHDTIDSVAYLVDYETLKFGYVTDTGKYPEFLLENFLDRNIIFMEANYEVDFLDQSSLYSTELKDRIRGGFGHCSNAQASTAIDYILNNTTTKIKSITLGHMSTRNNTESLVLKNIYDAVVNNTDIKFNILKEHDPKTIL